MPESCLMPLLASGLFHEVNTQGLQGSQDSWFSRTNLGTKKENVLFQSPPMLNLPFSKTDSLTLINYEHRPPFLYLLGGGVDEVISKVPPGTCSDPRSEQQEE